ncbi:MAG: SPFH domain-containing protein [Dysgonamonadaceae bacterium]|jgi:membrane protease subunit (stomatin/prohibitin family)|nr:SPFH domain-containing protein [Dysgonamonadaceae bacterium]
MGLIKAIAGAIGGVLADQWKEYFYCETLSANVLVAKGKKRTSERSSNTSGEQNIISNGAMIAVADGQCMIIVEQGKVVEVCAEPGEFKYDTSTEPSIFEGSLGTGIKEFFLKIGKRFTYGGDTGKDQRVYYFNTKEILGNKYGTPTPVPFRVVDKNIGLDIDIAIRCNGEYSYKLTNPILFYTNVCGNVTDEYRREEIDSMLKTELLTALQPAFAKISEMGVRYSALPGHTMELSNALNAILSEKWKDLRGLEIASFGVNSVTASKEDEDMIKQLQKSAVMRDPTMAAAALVSAQAQAMQDAAKNEGQGGAFMAFAGMNMAQNAGGMNAGNLFQMGQQQQAAQSPQATGWMCSCGATGNTGKFCNECGKPKPADANGWTCSCGAVSKGKFCSECGKPKPADAPLYKCDKCGWEPEDPANPPKFCPECGDPFDDNDKK